MRMQFQKLPMQCAAVLCVVLVGVTMGVYFQTGDHAFISIDDPGYVTANPRVRGGLTGGNVGWAFSATAMYNWHPLTWLSHMVDVEPAEIPLCRWSGFTGAGQVHSPEIRKFVSQQ